MKEYLDKQSAVDCTVFMDESFTNLCKFSDAFDVSSFLPVVVGTVITHHLLLTSLWVNVSEIPLKILLSPLTADVMVASWQMALLGYVAKQGIAIQERQAWLKLLPGKAEPTIESDSGSTSSKVKPVLDKVVLMLSKKDQLEAQSFKTPSFPVFFQNPPVPPKAVTPPPLPPPPSLAQKHSTPKIRLTHSSGTMATLMAQFKQSRSHGLSLKDTLTKNTPVKDGGRGDPMPTKKMLTPDGAVELPIKKQHTGSPSSERESETDHDKAKMEKKKKKKKKKKDIKSDPTVASDSEIEETEEQQEKHQWERKWKRELAALQEYWESHNIFPLALLGWNGGSHTGYLEVCMDANPIRSIADWKLALQKQSQGVGYSAAAMHCRLQTLKRMSKVKLSSQYSVHAEYLVEVFKYPGTGNRILTDAEDGYDSTPMIGLYGLVDPYSIVQITTTQSGVVGKDGKKKSISKCYCLLCDYVVQNHPSINNHVCTHLHLSLLCTINRFFMIEHSCADM